MEEESRIEEIVRLELKRLETDDERDYVAEFVEQIDQFIKDRVDSVIRHLSEIDKSDSLDVSKTKDLSRETHSRCSNQFSDFIGGSWPFPMAVADASPFDAPKKEDVEENIVYPKQEDDPLEEAATQLQNEATRLEETIQKIDNYISYLETEYEINTSVAQKVATTVLQRKGRILENVASMGSACGSVVSGNLFALLGLGAGAWNLGKTCRKIYKDVKKWKEDRRIPKAERRYALSEMNQLKEQLEQVLDRLKMLQSSWTSSSFNLSNHCHSNVVKLDFTNVS